MTIPIDNCEDYEKPYERRWVMYPNATHQQAYTHTCIDMYMIIYERKWSQWVPIENVSPPYSNEPKSQNGTPRPMPRTM